MKFRFTIWLVFLFLMISCQKEGFINADPYLENVKRNLQDSLKEEDFQRLDFDRALLSNVGSSKRYFLRIPFKEMHLENDYLILKTSPDGIVERGKIIHLEGGLSEWGDGLVKKKVFNGNISISSLNRENNLHSSIVNGYIEAFHKSPRNTRVVQPPSYLLPEVIVLGTRRTATQYSWSTWITVQNLLLDPLNGEDDYYYHPIGDSDGGGGYSGGGGGGGGGGGSLRKEPVITIDPETQYDNAAIEIEKFIKCFDAIPDFGSSCSIEIMTDIPVDSDPSKILNWETGSPGHTFINIRKSNGSQLVSQNIGFYPRSGWKTTISSAPIDGKFVDNGNHEYNASMKMKLSPENLRSTLTEILYLARFVRYDIDEYNCTDFALDVFNKTRSSKLEIPLYQIPGGMASAGTRTPQGVYNKLMQLKNSGSAEASSITIGIVKGWAGNSTGPCN